MTGVPFSAQLLHAQNGTCTVKLEIFRSDDNQNPILVKEFGQVPRPGNWSWTWDGKLADGTIAPRGIYTYRLSAVTYVPTLPDSDSNRSGTLRITETRLYPDPDLATLEYCLTQDGSHAEVRIFDPVPSLIYTVSPTTAAQGWNSAYLPGWQNLPRNQPGYIRYLVLALDKGDTDGTDKAHRKRWAVPLNHKTRVIGVVIDPGHGGRDPGTHGTYTTQGNQQVTAYERDVNLAFARALDDALNLGHPGGYFSFCDARYLYRTFMTRTDNITTLSSAQRIKLFTRAYSQGYDVLVSLHSNWSTHPETRGIQVYYCS